MKVVTKVLRVSDDFPPGFYEALGSFAVAFGRVEYQIKLAVKSLSGREFTAGMIEAESSRHFHELCRKARTLASRKLREPQLSQFTALVDEAIELASERNDNLHALWTADSESTARRIRPYWNRDTKRLKSKNRSMTVDELNGYANRLRGLFNSIQAARKSW